MQVECINFLEDIEMPSQVVSFMNLHAVKTGWLLFSPQASEQNTLPINSAAKRYWTTFASFATLRCLLFEAIHIRV